MDHETNPAEFVEWNAPVVIFIRFGYGSLSYALQLKWYMFQVKLDLWQIDQKLY